MPKYYTPYNIPLRRVPNVIGIYKRGENEDFFPRRWSLLRDVGPSPTPYEIFQRVMEEFPTLRVSDMIRSPDASLRARLRKRGVQLPGYSGHNFGISIDIDVASILGDIDLGWDEFKSRMVQLGATPYNKTSGASDFEAWHWNLLDLSYKGLPWGTKGRDVEDWITTTFGDQLYIGCEDHRSYWRAVQKAMAEFKFYDAGGIDGLPGPMTRAGLEQFRTGAKLRKKQQGGGLHLSSTEERVLAAILARRTIS